MMQPFGGAGGAGGVDDRRGISGDRDGARGRIVVRLGDIAARRAQLVERDRVVPIAPSQSASTCSSRGASRPHLGDLRELRVVLAEHEPRGPRSARGRAGTRAGEFVW